MKKFSWRSYDVNTLLSKHRPTWKADIQSVAARADRRLLVPRSVTSRESSQREEIWVLSVGGLRVRDELPWLYGLYRREFLELAQQEVTEPLAAASDDRHGIVLSVQRGTGMRYEAHVDSNPLEGLLYVVDLPRGSGGELVVANDPSARSVEEIEADASVIFPTEGNLIFFDAREFPHYVRPLARPEGLRIVAAMNFYTPSCPEAVRPPDLTPHLEGYEPDGEGGYRLRAS